MELNICHLYPDVLNLYGDRGNVTCMTKRLLWRGIDVRTTDVKIGDRLEAGKYDLFFIGGGQDFEQEVLLEDLKGEKTAQIRAAIEDGKTFLAICGGYQMLGQYYKTWDGVVCEFTGALDLYTEGSKDRMIGNYAFSFDELPGETGQEMNWAVNLVGKNIPTIALLNDPNDFNYEYTFNTVDNSPESDYFGRIYIGHRPGNNDANNGLWIYNPDWTKHNESVIKTRTDGLAFRSNYRIGIDCEGKVYMPDWGDPTSGVFVFDPANEEGGLYPFFAHADGTPLNRDGDGMLTNDDGVAVGGSSPGVFV